MFDPSFLELIVICVVALLVLGPDKLPGAIRTLGLWIGRLRRSFNNIRREIEQEVGADEIRRQLRNEAIMEKFNSTKNQVTESIQSVKKEAEAVKNELDLKKELSDFSEQPADAKDKNSKDEIDPIEKLATNDPTARMINNGKEDGAGQEDNTEHSGNQADTAGQGEDKTADNKKNPSGA